MDIITNILSAVKTVDEICNFVNLFFGSVTEADYRNIIDFECPEMLPFYEDACTRLSPRDAFEVIYSLGRVKENLA